MASKKQEELIDEVGKLDDKISILQTEHAVANEALKAIALEKAKKGDVLLGKKYSISVIERVSVTYDPKKIEKQLGNKFLQCVTVSIQKAKEFLSGSMMEKCVQGTRVSKYFSKPKKIK